MKEININRIVLFVLPIVSGIILGLSSLPSNFYFLSFFAFIPLLIASEKALSSKKPILVFCFQLLLFLVVYYFWVGHWILQTASLGFLVGLFIVIPFVLLIIPYIFLLKRKNKYASAYFIAAWLAVEMIQNYFQLGTPFYNLGNNLGANPKLIQWYEFTGTAGGSLWILILNFVLYSLGKSIISKRKLLIRKSIIAIGVLFVPIIISFSIYYNYNEKGKLSEVLIIHPSTDNYDLKYRINIYELMDIYMKIILPQLTENTEYVVLPETAITNGGWISDFNRNLIFNHFNKQTIDYPNLKLITGAVIYEAIKDVEKIKNYKEIPGIKYSKNYKTWYNTYNSALLIEKNRPVQIRVKDGLVPFQEFAPYPQILPHLLPVGIDFQFSKRKKNRQIFTTKNGDVTTAIICYELVYGNLVLKNVKNGAEAIFALLNEGWYSNIPKVPQQFLQLSVVRAIENRRNVAHSSNLGISAFINQRGDVVIKQESKEPEFLKEKIRLNKEKTFYTTVGNYLSIVASVSIVLILFGELKKKFSVTNKTTGFLML